MENTKKSGISMQHITSFFDKDYKTPAWLKNKLSRRNLLKSAAGASMIAAMPAPVFAKNDALEEALKSERWQTLDAVMNHLLPKAGGGPSAQDLQATQYLFNLVHQQPTDKGEVEFIYKGVGWLNGYTNKQHQKDFYLLTKSEKEQMLRAISQSNAGDNWLSMMIANLFEAMLAPPAYGGNPDGIGWRWLNHQAGFPLPKAGDRYYELPARSKVKGSAQTITISRDKYAYKKRDITKKVTKA